MAHRSRGTSSRSSTARRASSGASGAPPPDKTCAVCGRRITWRAKWARDWEQVRYCSGACRSRRGDDERAELVAAVRARLARCPAGSTVCPSEVARAVHSANGGQGEQWRKLLEPVREAARLLAADGELEITQGGRAVDPSTARGPVRLRPTGRPGRGATR